MLQPKEIKIPAGAANTERGEGEVSLTGLLPLHFIRNGGKVNEMSEVPGRDPGREQVLYVLWSAARR